MQRALDNLQMELLLASFLLARQINAENTSSHHYGVWFSSITSSSTTSKQFSFLLKFLTNIVRHEPAWVLLAHKNNPPSSIPIVNFSIFLIFIHCYCYQIDFLSGWQLSDIMDGLLRVSPYPLGRFQTQTILWFVDLSNDSRQTVLYML